MVAALSSQELRLSPGYSSNLLVTLVGLRSTYGGVRFLVKVHSASSPMNVLSYETKTQKWTRTKIEGVEPNDSYYLLEIPIQLHLRFI
jgi:hypothetical protein